MGSYLLPATTPSTGTRARKTSIPPPNSNYSVNLSTLQQGSHTLLAPLPKGRFTLGEREPSISWVTTQRMIRSCLAEWKDSETSKLSIPVVLVEKRTPIQWLYRPMVWCILGEQATKGSWGTKRLGLMRTRPTSPSLEPSHV